MSKRRADRLFQIIQLLRSGRLTTARDLANNLEVSARTIYRDIRDLMSSGVPIEGEAGVGYLMREGFDLPPLMFARDELQALLVGARMLRAWADPGLARAVDSALEKIRHVLPDEISDKWGIPVYAPGIQLHSRDFLGPVREAVESRQKLKLEYERADQKVSHRLVRPLGLLFWGRTWTLVAWCEKRDDFRQFRIDRILRLSLDAYFEEEAGRRMEDFIASKRHDG